jgi:hypothetical protein
VGPVQPDSKKFSPKQFLRARRPEKFSDSVVVEKNTLDRSILEYHIVSMTTRSQEVPFATFARHLAEREVCPNLLPQTGPTGGGDSKVDSETYPVSDVLALGWFVGVGREASSERWAFAFSAKKDWRPKVRSDVEKAVETGRGYSKIFFITNQAPRDKDRATVEDELRTKHGVDVRILDRTWILEKVFANGHEALAIEDLGLEISVREEVHRGPWDTEREAEIKETEERIQETLRKGDLSPRVVDDCIEGAILARELERPRTEVDGLFERAERIALKCGTDHQKLRCAYQAAWTAYWWHEDYERFSQLYDVVEGRAKGTSNSYELELLTNLWTLLYEAVLSRKTDRNTSDLAAHTKLLAEELERLSNQPQRPSGALHARTLRLQMRLIESIATRDSLETVLTEFREIILSSRGLSGFPLQPLLKILAELGEVIGNEPAFDSLFNAVLEASTERKAEIASARMLVTRAIQLFNAGKPYAAIRALGQSFGRLYKDESRWDAVRALYLCARAYERVGLLWAARGTTLAAASLAVAEFWKNETISSMQVACYARLKWVELQLGRIPQALSWYEVEMITRGALSGDEDTKNEISKEDVAFDATLGLMLLRTESWELKTLSRLPDALERLGLFNASAALLFALGYEDKLRDEGFFKEAGVGDNVQDYFVGWRNAPGSEDLPERPSLGEQRKIVLNSRLLGCRITVESENSSPCVELAESILAALEALMSTGSFGEIAALEPVLTISVTRSDFAEVPFEFTFTDDTGRPHIGILCGGFDAHTVPVALQGRLKDRILELLTFTLPRVFVGHDLLGFFKKLLDEQGVDRSLNFTGSFITVSNVLGHSPKDRISNWLEGSDRDYPPLRREPWEPAAPKAEKPTDPFPRPGEGEIPPELLDFSDVKQKEMETISLIRTSLWSKAKWVATVYGTDEEESVQPPILALGFAEPEAGKQIFRYLREDLGGTRDVQDRLRVSIIRGIDQSKPYSYRVVIGANLREVLSRDDARFAIGVSRMNAMNPASDMNLERFLRQYNKLGGYFLMPAAANASGSEMQFLFDYFLVKGELHIRSAWEIGANDPDAIGVAADDDPIIPLGQSNPPVFALLERKRKNESSHHRIER